MEIAGLEGLPEEERTQIDKLNVFVCIRYTSNCTHIPRRGLNVVCCVIDPKMLLTVILAVYTVPACSPMM